MIIQPLFSNTKTQTQYAFLTTVDNYFQKVSQQYTPISQIYHTHLIWPQKYCDTNEKKLPIVSNMFSASQLLFQHLKETSKYFPEK